MKGNAAALPVDEHIDEVRAALRQHGRMVLVAPTGSGKSTRVAPALLDDPERARGRVWLLQPRRVAARALARRIAHERGCEVGTEVGYRVRLEKVERADTRLIVATTGSFLAELARDPELTGTSTVILDEFHERSLEADLVLALVRELRDELGLDVELMCMSATLEAEPVARFLGDAPVVQAEGRAFDVRVEHLPPLAGERDTDTLERAVREWLLPQDDRGDALVFLPGAGEIRRTQQRIGSLAERRGWEVVPLYGELSAAEQDAVFDDGPRPKLILSTNVAETSLTLPRVTRVIDTGQVRRARFDPERGLTRLDVERASRASLEQRKGRAGRVAPGRCLRLFTPQEERAFPEREEPEVHRTDLADAVLTLAAQGVNARTFAWFEAPRAEALDGAEALLDTIGALRAGRITRFGTRLARMPLHPRLGALLAFGEEFGCPVGAATAAAILSERDPFERVPPHLVEQGRVSPPVPHGSDVAERARGLMAFERRAPLPAGVPELRTGPARGVLAVRDRLLSSALRMRDAKRAARSADEDVHALERALALAFADRLCARRAPGAPGARYLPGGGVTLAATSGVTEPDLFVAIETARTRTGSDPSVRLASIVEREWLDPEHFATSVVVEFDLANERVVERLEESWRGLVLSTREAAGRGEPADVDRAVGAAARAHPRRALDLDDRDVTHWLARLECLRAWRPDLELPAIDDAFLGAVAERAAAGCRTFAQTRRAPVLDWLRAELAPQQQRQLDTLAPSHVQVPSGSRIRLAYERDRSPVLAARIQELFGLAAAPSVAGGSVKVLFHLLAPNHRPQQVTDDLASFWANAYHDVRRELKRRYPRHSWPEDPLTATPERRPKRKR